MSNIKKASLVLKTSDLPFIGGVLDGSNEYGSINFLRTQMTWNNINLRLLLGDMYDSCDLFNLNIVQLSSTTPGAPGFGLSNSDRTIVLHISGLPFINQTYDVKNQCNINETPLCCFVIPATVHNLPFLFNFTNNSITFGKNQDMCNISISYKRVGGDNILSSSVGLNFQRPAADMTLIFNIVGVVKEPSYNNDKRLF